MQTEQPKTAYNTQKEQPKTVYNTQTEQPRINKAQQEHEQQQKQQQEDRKQHNEKVNQTYDLLMPQGACGAMLKYTWS